jgi:hypothetical protein
MLGGEGPTPCEYMWICRTIESAPVISSLIFQSSFDTRCYAAMSVLDDFMRMRLYRKRAAEFDELADVEGFSDAGRRYRGIARHYKELAEREEQLDKARIAERLTLLRVRRQAAAQTALAAKKSGAQLLILRTGPHRPQSSSSSSSSSGTVGAFGPRARPAGCTRTGVYRLVPSKLQITI